MPDGGRLWVYARNGEGALILAVEDTGVGMDQEKLRGVLRGESGGGLGLSIVSKLLRQNGGRLELDSQPGRGTRARAVFPGKGGEQ